MPDTATAPTLADDAKEQAADAATAATASQAAAMEQAMKLPQEVTRFCAQRMSRDLETMQALGRCRTPAEIMNVWSAAAQAAAEDYRDEMVRMVDIVTNGAANGAAPKKRKK